MLHISSKNRESYIVVRHIKRKYKRYGVVYNIMAALTMSGDRLLLVPVG